MKIAVCFFGQLRTFRYCATRMKEVFEKQGQVDYFIHTWNRENYGVYNQSLNCTLDRKALGEELCYVFSPKKILVEDELTCGDLEYEPFDPRQALFYSISRTLGLMKEYVMETKTHYDAVICIRPDVWLYTDKLIVPEQRKVYLQAHEYDSSMLDFGCIRTRDLVFLFSQETAMIFQRIHAYARLKLLMQLGEVNSVRPFTNEAIVASFLLECRFYVERFWEVRIIRKAIVNYLEPPLTEISMRKYVELTRSGEDETNFGKGYEQLKQTSDSIV